MGRCGAEYGGDAVEGMGNITRCNNDEEALEGTTFFRRSALPPVEGTGLLDALLCEMF